MLLHGLCALFYVLLDGLLARLRSDVLRVFSYLFVGLFFVGELLRLVEQGGEGGIPEYLLSPQLLSRGHLLCGYGLGEAHKKVADGGHLKRNMASRQAILYLLDTPFGRMRLGQ